MEPTVLCVSDFTASSGQLIKQACQITKQMHHRLEILFCYRLAANSVTPAEDIKKFKTTALKHFAKFESDFIKGFEISYSLCAEVGFVSDRVEDHLRNENISFLILDKKMKWSQPGVFDEILERTNLSIILISSGEPH